MDEREHVTPARTMQTEVLARIWMDGGDETSLGNIVDSSISHSDHWGFEPLRHWSSGQRWHLISYYMA